MGYTLIFGKGRDQNKKGTRFRDVEEHPGKTPKDFSGLEGEGAHRYPGYGVWAEVVKCIPDLDRIWRRLDSCADEGHRVFKLEDYKSSILPLETHVDQVADPHLKIRLQWFFYWYKKCLKDYGKKAVLYIG